MSETKVHTIGCLPIIFIVFLILKLTNVITWSWLWVCSPLILAVGMWFLFYVIIGIVIAALFRYWVKK